MFFIFSDLTYMYYVTEPHNQSKIGSSIHIYVLQSLCNFDYSVTDLIRIKVVPRVLPWPLNYWSKTYSVYPVNYLAVKKHESPPHTL